MSQVRTVLLIQVLHSFVSGVFGVALPLMMTARNIDIATIGLVYASMPLIMQFGRMLFATVSDFWGRKPFFVANGVLGVVSGLAYYFAHTHLGFLSGKIAEGTKEGTLWAVNRAYLLEKNGGHWRILVYLRTVAYAAIAVGSLLAGFFVVLFLYEGTMLLCILIGILSVLVSLLLVGEKKEKFSKEKALHFLDFRKKGKMFKIFLVLFFVLGFSFGFVGYVIPLFLQKNGFTIEAIGLIIGVQVLLAGLFSYLFAKTTKMRQLILWSGALFSATFILLGYSGAVLAGALVIFYGVVEGMVCIGHEGVLPRICTKESYGIDIGLLMMGLHLGETFSMALSGIFIALWGFAVPFLLAALTYVVFYVGAYRILKE